MRRIVLLLCLLLMTFMWGIRENKKEEQTVTEPYEEQIRVLIKNDDYESVYHQQICFYSDRECQIMTDGSEEFCDAGTWQRIDCENRLFSDSEKIRVRSDGGKFYFPELVRAERGIGYEGELEIRKTSEGLLLINELPLETYLCGVLPGEMSASFPVEALKAQAVCARTYALKQKEEKRAAKYDADLDDSMDCQVYNNRQHSEQTDLAVRETKYLVMEQQGAYVDARYYSTSCGLDLHLDLSENEVLAAFLQENQSSSVEAEEPFFRWKTRISLDDFKGKSEWERIEQLQVTKRDAKGAAMILEVTGLKTGGAQQADGTEHITEEIEGEYQIRQFLALADPVITLQDKSTREGWKLLPSAFILLNPVMEGEVLTGYEILGGGYGHGEGMSQNGAKHMAEQGESWKTILNNYYGEIEVIRYNS